MGDWVMVNGDAGKGDCGTSDVSKGDGGNGNGTDTGVFVEMKHSFRVTRSMPYTQCGICCSVLSKSFTQHHFIRSVWYPSVIIPSTQPVIPSTQPVIPSTQLSITEFNDTAHHGP